MFRLLFVLFLLVPLIELFVLIEVGDVIGAGWTILLVLATAILGALAIYKHKSNIQRLLAGTENRVGRK